MAIETFYQYWLTCDVCGKKTKLAPPEEVLQEAKDWRLNSYKQSPGYTYYALTCGQEHENTWEEAYMGRAALYGKEACPIEKWLSPVWSSRNYPSGPQAMRFVDIQAPGLLD